MSLISTALSHSSLAGTAASGVPPSNGDPHDVYTAIFGEPAAEIGSMSHDQDPFWCMDQEHRDLIDEFKEAGKPVRYLVHDDPRHPEGRKATEQEFWEHQRKNCEEEEAAERAFNAEQQNAGHSGAAKPARLGKVATM